MLCLQYSINWNGWLLTLSISQLTHCMLQVIIMHRSIFESLMRTLKGHLLYQAEYLSRLLVKQPAGRSEADVLKLASYLTSLQRFQASNGCRILVSHVNTCMSSVGMQSIWEALFCVYC